MYVVIVQNYQAPIYNKNTNEEKAFIDKHVCCNSSKLPTNIKDIQTHKHSHTFSKKENHQCCLGFPKFSMLETLILLLFTKEQIKQNCVATQNLIKIK